MRVVGHGWGDMVRGWGNMEKAWDMVGDGKKLL